MSSSLTVTKAQARRFLLRKHGLIGEHLFHGSEGVYRYIAQAGSIQFDPLNVCGRNADLTLQSRIPAYAPAMLSELLYTQRRLVDYFDKELCIFPIDQWPYYARIRELRGDWMRSHEQVAGARDAILQAITERGPLSSKDLDTGDKVNWFWGDSRLSRAVLEHLYYAGILGVHHKQGSIKHYDLIERLLPLEIVSAPDPHQSLESLHDHLLLRRVGAVGMLWDRSSPAFLGIPGFTNVAAARQAAFQRLLKSGILASVRVEGLRESFYLRADELPVLENAGDGELQPRCELLAPLDPLMWDRSLIRALFDFDYTWEVYVPPAKRKHGYYVLPLLQGERFVGRAEPVWDKRSRSLQVKGLWYEPEIKVTAAIRKTTQRALERFERFLRLNAGIAPDETAP